MTSWVFEGPLLPRGERGRIVVGSGDRQALTGRFALPGLVDGHCHITLGSDDRGPHFVDKETAEVRLGELARQGVTALRDTGGDRTITLPLAAEVRAGWPVIAASGRFFSSAGRYFNALYEPVAADGLVQAIHDEIDAGATWIKLIGDFPATDDVTVVKGSAIEPTYDSDTISAAIRTAHDRGVRVAVHTNSALVSELVSAGADSIEHGTLIRAEDIAALGRRRGAWTPTLCASVRTSPAQSEAARKRRQDASERFKYLLPLAVRAGVRVLAGSDAVGTVAQEVRLLVEHGLTVEDALAAGTTSAHEYLGIGGEGDVVTYDHDPRDDPEALNEPAAVVVRGVRVR